MGHKFMVSYEKRNDAIEKYIQHEDSLNHLDKKLSVSSSTITHC